jgi:hypothetical protein
MSNATETPLAQAAKAVRADIKAAVTANSLPPHPEGITFRVRCERASLMTAVRVEILNVPRSWLYDDRPGAVNRPSPASLILRSALTRIAARHYHADGQGSFITAEIDLETEVA